MDLPPDKAKLLKSYDDDKKWDLICDQVRHLKSDIETFCCNRKSNVSTIPALVSERTGKLRFWAETMEN